MKQGQDLASVFAVLKPDLSVAQAGQSPTVYRELDERFEGFRGHVLVAGYEFGADWGMWEQHPAGDELVVLMSGAATMVYRVGDDEFRVRLTDPGTYVVVPRGAWHTAVEVAAPTRMLFITPGEGTDNQENPWA